MSGSSTSELESLARLYPNHSLMALYEMMNAKQKKVTIVCNTTNYDDSCSGSGSGSVLRILHRENNSSSPIGTNQINGYATNANITN